ncbi:MAG: hypothetical protein JSR34_11025 [Proteobacteria bacterium]|nr:hypothetical protein [Pseudomonadota bacterium]
MTAIRSALATTLIGLVFGIASSSPAQAADRHVKVVNGTHYTIVRFFASSADSDSWEEDILGDNVLKPGMSARINIDDGSGACVFDFKAVFSDGDSLVRRGVNVCEVETYTYSED